MRVGIVTSFPDGDVRKSGIAGYADALIEPLTETADDIVVFADHPPGTQFRSAERRERIAHNIIVVRCWRFGALSPFMLYRSLKRERFDVLHVEYDFYLYGGVVAALLLPILLKLLSLQRRFVLTTTFHGVVPQSAICPEMLRENGLVLPFSAIGKVGFRIIYALFRSAGDRFIALESELAKVLCADYGYPQDRTFAVPCPNLMHAPKLTEPVELKSQLPAKKLLYFGYASYYKGLFLLLDAFEIVRKVDPEVELQVVSGRHPRLAGNTKYETFFSKMCERARQVGANHHDFMPERELSRALSECDAVILPYTKMYGASGPLSTAIAARKPVLVSRVLYFQGALPGQVFETTPKECAKAIVRFFNGTRQDIERNLDSLAAVRNNETIASINHRIRCGADPLTLPSVTSSGALRGATKS